MMEDELVHAIKNLVQQEMREIRPFVYAHVCSYNSALHAVRVVVPSMRDELTNEPLLSGWLQLGTLQTGAGTGVQVAPVGGASVTDPTAGEQCLVALNDRGIGVASIIAMFFNNKLPPPSPVLATPLNPGEMVAYSNGILVRWNSSGTLTINTTRDIDINCSGSIVATCNTATVSGQTIVVTGTTVVDILSSGTINLGATGGKPIARGGDIVQNGTTTVGTITASSLIVKSI